MILIHGKIDSVELQDNNNKIVVNFNDNSKHYYLYDNVEKKIFFIIPGKDLVEGEEEKYITLCDGINNCEFSYANNRLVTKIYIEDRIYTNNFNI